MLKPMRWTLAAIVLFFGSFVIGVLALLRPFNAKMGLLWCKTIPHLGLKLMGLRVEIRNHEIMKINHPCIFIANHQHALDLFVHGYLQCVPIVAIGKKELKWIPFFGWVFWLSGQILINRQSSESAIASLKQAGDRMKRENLSCWIFPEGTRSQKGLLPFKKGAFHLAIQSQLPIVPIVGNHFKKSVNFSKWDPGKVILQVLPPIPTKGLTTNDIENLMLAARTVMENEIAKLDAEVDKSNYSMET